MLVEDLFQGVVLVFSIAGRGKGVGVTCVLLVPVHADVCMEEAVAAGFLKHASELQRTFGTPRNTSKLGAVILSLTPFFFFVRGKGLLN